MKFSRYSSIFLLVFTINTVVSAQNKPDDIVGYYLNNDPFSGSISQVYIYNAGDGTYEGIVIWTKDNDRKQFEGFIFMTGLTFNAKENEWQNAIFIYPGKKGTYQAYMRIEKDGRLRLRGYWSISLLGKTLYWNREQQSRNLNIRHP